MKEFFSNGLLTFFAGAVILLFSIWNYKKNYKTDFPSGKASTLGLIWFGAILIILSFINFARNI